MPSILDYIYDTAFVKEAISYLQSAHDIHAAVIDSHGQPVPLDNRVFTPLPFARDFPFTAVPEIGSLRCLAAAADTLAKAEPHIRLCLKGIDVNLLREIELHETTNEMLQLSKELSFLFNLAQKLIGVNQLDQCCKIVLDEIALAIGADYAFLQIDNGDAGQLDISYNLGEAEVGRLRRLPVLQGFAKDKTTIVSLPDGASTLISPIREKNGSLGTMIFIRIKSKRFFTAYEKKFVSIIENIISPSLETLRLYDSLRDIYLNTVKALAAAIDAKDEYTHGHSFRVAKYAVAIGAKLNLTAESLADLEIAAYMHDLGKIGIPESILGKPAKLDLDEYAQIKQHPVYTSRILEPINLPDLIVRAAIHHHERLNGSGYPFGLNGDEISLFARIIAVADVFDAATSNRPYREAKPVETVLGELCERVNEEFDQEVVLALIAALMDHKEAQKVMNIYPDLKFCDIDKLNHFLVGLLKFIQPEKTPTF